MEVAHNNSMTFPLKIPYTLDSRHRGKQFQLTRRLSSCWVIFTGLEDAVTGKKKKTQWSDPALDPECYNYNQPNNMDPLVQ